MQDNQQLTNLIDELGLSSLNDDAKANLVAKLAETLQNRIFVALMDGLDDNEKNELNNMASNSSDEQLNEYLKQKFPDLNDITTQEYEKLRAEMLESKNDITGMINSYPEQQQPPQDQQN